MLIVEYDAQLRQWIPHAIANQFTSYQGMPGGRTFAPSFWSAAAILFRIITLYIFIMSKTVGDFLVERLLSWNVTRIYGYPGDGINGIMGALR